MKKGNCPSAALLLSLLLLVSLSAVHPAAATAEREVKIGVLAKRGEEISLARWQPTAAYLSREIPGYRFLIQPLDFPDVLPTAADDGVEFYIVNSGIYVELEHHYGAGRILTIKNRYDNQGHTEFGGVIFTRRDHPAIHTIPDLRGQSFAAVKSNSLGGFQMAWRELHEQGIDPKRDLRPLIFTGTHDGVVRAVQDGRAAAGTVRSDTLERMAAAGLIDLADFRIINPRTHPGFPFLVSTRLYPEWPLARARHTSEELADRVAGALLAITADHQAALEGEYTGWTVPRNYQPVHEMMRVLQIGPYAELGKITLRQVLDQYRQVLALAGALALTLIVSILHFLRLNRRLRRSEQALRRARDHLEERVRDRTAELGQINRLLEEENHARLEALRTLADERQRLSVTLRSIGDGVITTDTAARVELLNAEAERLCGWPEEEALGRPLREIFNLINHRTGVAVVSPVEEVLATGKLVELANHVALVARDGSRRSIADSGAPIIDIDGAIIGAVLVFRDVTEKERLEEESFKAQKLESVGVLAGGIAHDFNNLLTAIHGNVSLARLQLPADQPAVEFLKETEKAIMRATGLSRQLLTFAKGGTPIRRVISLAETIRESVELTLRGSNVRAEFRIASDIRPVEVDAGQIAQVVQNLVINACQAMPGGGNLLINCENFSGAPPGLAPGDWLRLTIADQGPGIPPEIRDRIFDPYFTTKEGGSGLGLAVCHTIISKHDGSIFLTSETGQGTEFTIMLPAATEEKIPAANTTATRRAGPARVLVMDDEPMVADVLRQSLERLGHLVTVVADGAAAVTAWNQAAADGHRFAWGFLDLTVPGKIGGRQAAVEILHHDPAARLIVVSGYTNDGALAEPHRHGFQGSLTKPYNPRDLETIVGNAAVQTET